MKNKKHIEIIVYDENNFFKFKLTQKDRRLLKKTWHRNIKRPKINFIKLYTNKQTENA